jgi:hypothetical protein
MTMEKLLVNAVDVDSVKIFLNGKYPRRHVVEARPVR